MSTRRQAKLSQAIKEVISAQILARLRDPRIKNVTVLEVEVAEDVKTAKVFISVMGSPTEQRLAVAGLNSARGYLQQKIADRLQTKNTPVLTFKLDDRVKKSIETSRLLDELSEELRVVDEERADAESDQPTDAEGEAEAETTIETGGETEAALEPTPDTAPEADGPR